MEGNITHHSSKIIGEIDMWDLTISQCNQSCTICTITFKLEHPFASDQSLLLSANFPAAWDQDCATIPQMFLAHWDLLN